MKTKTLLLTDYKSLLGGQDLSVLFVGNNPGYLSSLIQFLRKMRTITFNFDTAFDLKESLQKALTSKPKCIVIDDENLDKMEIEQMLEDLRKNKDTEDIAVTLIKHDNYKEFYSLNIQDYLLENNISSESLFRSIINAIKFKRTQRYLYRTYKTSKNQVKNLISSLSSLK
ncbi:hypothetical protein [Marinigracilibium pacificum]|uniref:Response regulatory domain-containing protein n=1 Tax=Marinigracilibium pacificum TaxID=2729599 RepID=A0A848IUP0_9BACT|nr:hypothetical protein [Marinigracilibium pacificum]NMM47005.1 hypothetical protein [Marinigracilibium pacificum]